MRRSYGYGSYRGRGRGRGLRTVLIIVVVLLVLLIFSFFFLSRYLVYTDDGVRLELPFLRGEREDDQPEETDFVVETPQPTVPVVVEEFHIKAAELPLESLTAGTVQTELAALGANTVIFDMKTDEGYLGYVSNQEDAIKARVSQADPDRNEAIKALNETAGLYTVARISCFRDLEVSSNRLSYSIMSTNGYRWRDPERLRWLSPMNENAVHYLLGVVDELCVLGFDEILLENCAYPTGEKTESIAAGQNYPAEAAAREQSVMEFLEEVKAVTDSRGVKLSIRTTPAALEGLEAATSGLIPAVLLNNADHLWLSAAGLEGGIAYQSEGDRTGAEEKLVVMVPSDGSVDPASYEAWAKMD